jgi:hypothetical protein
MPEEGFFHRWARRKAEVASIQEDARPAAPLPLAEPARRVATPSRPHAGAEAGRDQMPSGSDTNSDGAARKLPTLDDVAALTADSDYSAFVMRGVDKSLQRLAMKKLFSDPHFNVMDGLDIYIDDYNQPSPVSAAMLASLHHAKNLFAPLASEKEQDADALAAPTSPLAPASPAGVPEAAAFAETRETAVPAETNASAGQPIDAAGESPASPQNSLQGTP